MSTIMSIEDDYQHTIEWLYNLHLFGIKFGLKKVEKLLYYLGNPQDKLQIIHVGGTNGKGSVCAILSSILAEAGFKVGVNSSPHLSEFTERITINGKQITKEDVVKYAELLKRIREKVNSETHLGYATYFEVVTAMALKYFYDSNLDFIILEVGLGGTFDATNAVRPVLTIITDVSLDHTEHLGNTLTSVAENKAGIIKSGIPVITSNTKSEVLDVISGTCKTLNSKFYCLEKDFKYIINSSDLNGHIFDYHGLKNTFSNLNLPLLGRHQCKNSAVALCALEVLQQQTGIQFPNQAINTGLEHTYWPGRLEVMQKSPWVIVDGAHNPAGAKSLCEALELFNYDKLSLVFGCSEEKDIKNLLINLLPLADKIYLTQANIRRAAEPEIILENVKNIDVKIKTSNIIIKSPVATAVKTALDGADENDLVCICGSLFIVGEARDFLLKNDNTITQKKHRIHY